MCNNNMQAGPNINTERLPGYRNPDASLFVQTHTQQQRLKRLTLSFLQQCGSKEGATVTPGT